MYILLQIFVRKIINNVLHHPDSFFLMVLIFKVTGKCFESLDCAFLMLH